MANAVKTYVATRNTYYIMYFFAWMLCVIRQDSITRWKTNLEKEYPQFVGGLHFKLVIFYLPGYFSRGSSQEQDFVSLI